MFSVDDILSFFLPPIICKYFEVVRMEDNNREERLDIWFDERKLLPAELDRGYYIAYGFTDYTEIQDFPIKGKAVWLHLRRRKWLNTSTRSITTRNWDFAFEGTSLSKDFALFLKEAHRYQSGKL